MSGLRHPLVVFDFDGVLADSAGWMLDVLPGVIETFGLAPLTRDQLQALRGAPTREVVKALRAPAWKIPFIATHMRKLSAADAHAIPRFDGVPQLFAALKAAGATTAVVSSNGEATLRAVLAAETMAAVDVLDAGIGLYGKAARLKRLARRVGRPVSQAVYIGDETRDIDAARKAGFSSAAVSWGYATRDVLVAAGPTVVVDTIPELRAWLGV